MIKRKCLVCGKTFYTYPSRVAGNGGHSAKYCSRSCYSKVRDKEIIIRGLKTRFRAGTKQSEEQIQHRVKFITGEKNNNWKGDNVGYRGLHYWLRRQLGNPTKCSACGLTAKPSERRIDWANIDHKYRRNINDYIPLCKSCHKLYDLSHKFNHR